MGDEQLGQQLARWAIRIAVALYVWRVASELRQRRSVIDSWIPSRGIVIIWSAGCVMYLIHVALAFDAFHDWSHDAAVEFTAVETERMVGIRRGEGVWVNYVFSLIWIIDCARLTRAWHRGEPTVGWQDWLVHTFFAGIVFSATVVFGPPVYRWLAILVAIVWLAAWRPPLSRRR